MRTAQDFISLTAAIQMDIRAAQAKLTELRAWIANLPLPTEDHPFNEDNALTFVRNTGWQYTDTSLADELALMGANPAFIDRALLAAAEVRRAQPQPTDVP